MVRNDISSTMPTKPSTSDQCGDDQAQIRHRQTLQTARARDRAVRLDDARQAGRSEDHHGDEQHSDIDQPGVGQQADAALQQRDQDRAKDRTAEYCGAADIGHQQRVRRERRGQGIECHDLIGNRVEPATDAGEEAGQRELQEPHHAWDRSR